VVIVPDGNDTWIEHAGVTNFRAMEAGYLLALIRQAGIAGMGGAGFPTGFKLRPPECDRIHTLILNGAECEPYITADDMLMRKRADDVVGGLAIMTHILAPERILVAIEDNKPEAIATMRAAAGSTPGTGKLPIEIVAIPTKYPSGGEKQLIQILTGQEVPHGGIPADIGVLCQNVGTAAAVNRAVRHGEPLLSRITALAGEGLESPGTWEVLLGTPIRFLLEQSGFCEERTQRLVLGGPLMGFTLDSPDVPVIKTTNCVIAGSSEEFPPPAPAQPCIRCGQCAEVCPMELLPQQLFWFAQAGEYDKAEQHNLFDCIECGACAYVCPSTIPLVHHYRHAKGEIRQQQEDKIKSDQARERFEARQIRLEREQAEKAARRKARAEATATAGSDKRSADAQPNARDKRSAASAAVQAALARKAERQAKKSGENDR
jgi:electron transport complex protein RnfC